MSGKLVVFDFDGVLVAGDSMASMIRRLIAERWYKRALAYLVFPVAVPLLLSRRWFSVGAGIFRRIAFTGMSGDELRERLAAFGQAIGTDARRVRPRAVEALRAHLAAGDRVLVASGSEETIVRGVFEAWGLADLPIIASQVDFDPAVRLRRHCFGPGKCLALAELGHERWDIAYSDSLTDLPLLRGAELAVLVNASPEIVAEATKQLGRAPELVDWR